MPNRILVLAHDTALRASLARVLMQAGYQVELAAGAKRARELAAHTEFALAIVALDRSKAVGADLAREVGQAVGGLVVIRPSGQADDPSELDLECNACLHASWDERELLAEVESVLRQQGNSSQQNVDLPVVLSFDGFALDVTGRTLLDANQREVPLTPSEFALLLAFARAPGRVLSRDQLRNEVAGRAMEPYDRSIDMLRRKIEPDTKSPRYIITFPGAGYKFTAKIRETPAAAETAPQPGGTSAKPADSEADGFAQGMPALAVLPFANMSGDPEQDYFADGLVEEIITALSRGKWFLVMARNSSFTYKGRAVDVKQVGRELGVQYVLEGSVRKSGQRVRITTQLVEAESGAHVWAEKYDGAVEDIFDFQDHITACVVAAIEPHLRDAEIKRGQRRRPRNLTAYDYFHRGMAQFATETAQGVNETLRLLSLAMDSDPSYAPPYALAAMCRVYRLVQSWSDDPSHDAKEAVRLAQAAIELDRDDPTVLALAGHAFCFITTDYGTSLALVARCLALNPNSPIALQMSGYVRIYAGDADGAIECFARNLRLGPLDTRNFTSLCGMSWALIMAGRSDEAIGWGRKCIDANPLWLSGHKMLAIALANVGDLAEAREVAAHVMSIDQFSNLSHALRLMKPGPGRDRYIEGGRKAGFPD